MDNNNEQTIDSQMDSSSLIVKIKTTYVGNKLMDRHAEGTLNAKKCDYSVLAVLETDKLELMAYLSLYPKPGRKDYPSLTELMEYIRFKGISFGQNMEALSRILMEMRQSNASIERALIASGTKPLPAFMGPHEWVIFSGNNLNQQDGISSKEVDIREFLPLKVYPDQLIMTRPLKASSIKGMSVMGRVIIPPPPPLEGITIGEYIKLLKSTDKEEYFSEISGTLILEGNQLKVEYKEDGTFNLDIAKDKMFCYLNVYPPVGMGKSVTTEMVSEAIDKQGIYQTPEMRNAMEQALLNDLVDRKGIKKMIIALGRNPAHGQDGRIEYHFPTAREKKIYDFIEDKVDFHEVLNISSVAIDTVLASRIPPTPALEDGLDVFGHILPAQDGKTLELVSGRNTKITEDRSKLLAAIEGEFTMDSKGLPQVTPIMNLKNIDFSVGNIQFIGKVVINGNVGNGFKVEAGQDLYIKGVVEGADVSCGGNLFIGKGCFNSKASAKGEIVADFLENSTVEAMQDITVKNSIIRSVVLTNGKLTVGSPRRKGSILGNLVIAQMGVYSNVIGSSRGIKMKVIVGKDYDVEKKIKEYEEKTMEMNNKVIEMDRIRTRILKEEPNGKNLNSKQKETLDKLNTGIESINQILKKIQDEYIEMMRNYKEIDLKNIKVVAKHLVYSDVIIQFRDFIYPTEKEMQNVQFYIKEGDNEISFTAAQSY